MSDQRKILHDDRNEFWKKDYQPCAHWAVVGTGTRVSDPGIFLCLFTLQKII